PSSGRFAATFSHKGRRGSQSRAGPSHMMADPAGENLDRRFGALRRSQKSVQRLGIVPEAGKCAWQPIMNGCE
ncbi:hypothetical protein, partial [Mesorhizobium sp.]|uniref:hypothetical protein n=1 Tax=Mesorhizobium sp. TaxID=1871066 RepID=UPI00257A537F